jgi:small subunit ribosomal protein S20
VANHKSSKKRARQAIKRTFVNKTKKSRVRSAIKALHAAVSEKNKDEASKIFVSVQKYLSKLAKSPAVKKRTASRLTSRLAQQVNSL